MPKLPSPMPELQHKLLLTPPTLPPGLMGLTACSSGSAPAPSPASQSRTSVKIQQIQPSSEAREEHTIQMEPWRPTVARAPYTSLGPSSTRTPMSPGTGWMSSQPLRYSALLTRETPSTADWMY